MNVGIVNNKEIDKKWHWPNALTLDDIDSRPTSVRFVCLLLSSINPKSNDFLGVCFKHGFCGRTGGGGFGGVDML